MKLFSASIATETNTFAPAPTGRAAFESGGLFHADRSLDAPDGVAAMRHLKAACDRAGHVLAPGLNAYAEPSGRVVRHVYEELRDELLDDLRRAMPVDAVLLFMHGAMVAEGIDDCGGDLLERVRSIVGPDVAVGAELDLHCHMTEAMRAAADVVIAYKEYPHTDVAARCDELLDLLVRTAEGSVRPTTAIFDCRMVGIWRTTTEPMASFVRRMQSFEGRDGVLSVSLGHGFPWGDVADAGARLWVITDDDPALARQLASRLGREFWEMREATRPTLLSIDEALDDAMSRPEGPIVIADVADNPGGGAPADSTFLLSRLLERGIGNVVYGAFWDVGAIQICVEAGEGAEIELRVGGKCGRYSGQPVDLRVTVRAISEFHEQDAFGSRLPMGRSVWVESEGGIHIVFCSLRIQVYGTDAFTGLGLTLSDKRLIIVKSTQHFHAAFAPIARRVLYADSPGALTSAFETIPYRVRSLDYWPRVADPHGANLIAGTTGP